MIDLKFGDLVRYPRGRGVHQVRLVGHQAPPPSNAWFVLLMSTQSGHYSSRYFRPGELVKVSR